MNKDEYLKELKSFIRSLTNEEQSEAIQYYSDYFDEAGDDEKVIGELGSPEDLAKTIIEKMANVPVEKKHEKDTENNQNKTSIGALYYEFDEEQVKNLVIKVGAAEVVIVSGKKYSVETRGVAESDMFCSIDSKGCLTISNTKKFVFINILSHERINRLIPRILITIPQDAKIERFLAYVGAGSMESKNISLYIKEGSAEVGAGNLILKNIYGGNLSLRCGMGNLVIHGTATGRCNIDCGMGSVKMKLNGNQEDYSYDAKVGLGEFKINNEKKGGIIQSVTQSEKENHLSVNCGMGSVNISIK